MHKRLASLGSLLCFIARVLRSLRGCAHQLPLRFHFLRGASREAPGSPRSPQHRKKELDQKMFKYPLCEVPGLYWDGNPQSSLGQGNGGLLGLP